LFFDVLINEGEGRFCFFKAFEIQNIEGKSEKRGKPVEHHREEDSLLDWLYSEGWLTNFLPRSFYRLPVQFLYSHMVPPMLKLFTLGPI
jgi:hypothetical protein